MDVVEEINDRVERIIRSMIIISGKYAAPSASVYNTVYLAKLAGMQANSEEKINTVVAIAKAGIEPLMNALEISKLPRAYVLNMRRLFKQLIELTS